MAARRNQPTEKQRPGDEVRRDADDAAANRAHTGSDVATYPEARDEHDPSPTERTEGEEGD